MPLFEIPLVYTSALLIWSPEVVGIKQEKNRETAQDPTLEMFVNVGTSWWSSGQDCASTAGGTGSTPGWGTKIPHTSWWSSKKKEKKMFINVDSVNIIALCLHTSTLRPSRSLEAVHRPSLSLSEQLRPDLSYFCSSFHHSCSHTLLQSFNGLEPGGPESMIRK